MKINFKTLFAILVCSAFFMSCEPEAMPEQDIMTNVSKDIDPVGDSGSEQNDVDHRGED